MPDQLFGTDGVRGKANRHPIVPHTITALAIAAAQRLTDARLAGGHRTPLAVIANDTRRSAGMVESALAAGLLAMGVDVQLLGPLPTPACAIVTRSLQADLGVMVTASHNPYTDNGIKFFWGDGHKISSEDEAAIEALVREPPPLPPATKCGRLTHSVAALLCYIDFVKATLPPGTSLEGLKVVIDSANGAACAVAPRVLRELGAGVVEIASDPRGDNINEGCGATCPALLQAAVLEHGADIGIALDGDADRVICVDERGEVVDGDQLMAAIATHFTQTGALRGGGIVATIMSNLGLERCLESMGLALFRSAVGDRHVSELMQANGCNVGGEQSGHVILSDVCTTGDGLVAALQVLLLLQGSQRRASDALRVFAPVPQQTRNVRFETPVPPSALDDPQMVSAMSAAREALGPGGRLVVRRSGTEPVVRLMAEGDDAELLTRVLHSLERPLGEAVRRLQQGGG